MGIKLPTIFKVVFVLGMVNLVVVASASADGIPQILPADPSTIPAHDQIFKILSLILILFVLGLIVIVVSSIWKIVSSLHQGAGVAGGAVGSLIVSLIFIYLTVNQGTSYLTGWTGFFS